MIAVSELAFSYHSNAPPVLTDLSVAFPAGDTTVVTGPSGCGKSTLLYVLGLMLRPTAGRLEINGADAATLPDAERSGLRAERIGFVFQDAVLDPTRTIIDNVLEGGLYAGINPSTARSRALDLLRWFGVEERPNRRPGEISGGQAQRVALCRALLKQPSILLADEPTGNLDRASADIVWQALAVARDEGAAVVVATHDLSRSVEAQHTVRL
ncbi:MAG: ABC transporter [Chloroflexi bacterium]|nr:MAG: ABC transporter [Chloroflexota bacterium]